MRSKSDFITKRCNETDIYFYLFQNGVKQGRKQTQ